MTDPLTPAARPTPPAVASQSPPPRVSRLANAARAFGVAGIVTSCVGVGTVLGLVALVLGFVALHKINSRPAELGGKGQALTGIVAGAGTFLVTSVVFAIAISFGQAHDLANRVTCAANIRGTLIACLNYAEENAGAFPTAGTSPTGAYTLGWGASTSTTDEAAALADIQNNAKGNPASCLWILCIQGTISPKGLQCRSDPTASSSPSPLQTASGQFYRSPASDKHLSYSIASPWAIDPATGNASSSGVWRSRNAVLVPMISDIAPMNGTPSSGYTRNLFADNPNPQYLNSANHAGQGQNVGFRDAAVEWCRKPNVGQNHDNIFTTSTAASAPWGNAQPTAGTPITPSSTTDPFDVIMIPCRNLNDNSVH